MLATLGTVKEVLGGVADYPVAATQAVIRSSSRDSADEAVWLSSKKGVPRIVTAALSAPRDYTMALAEGFRNAPRLYGDESVREKPVIVGFGSGVVAAGKVCCFRLGVWFA